MDEFQRTTPKEHAARSRGFVDMGHVVVDEEDKHRDVLAPVKIALQHLPAVNTASICTLPENQKHTKQQYLETCGRAWKPVLKGSQQNHSVVLCVCRCPFVCMAVDSVCTEQYTQVCATTWV